MRWRLDLAYDGTAFHGWARQPGLRTVQGVLEEWIPTVLRLPDPVGVVVAGRTDAGVHARGQVVHFDLPTTDDIADPLTRRLRRVLPEDITLWSITPAPPGFDARFSAAWRRYAYRLSDGPPDPLTRGFITASRHPLDVATLNAAGALLTGLRDFAPFCKPREGATTIRDLRELEATRNDTGVIEIHLLADAFCHSMVRSIVGAMTEVGAGRRPMSWLEDVLTSERRHPDVPLMPARGLTLEEVGYPPEAELAGRARLARAMRSLPGGES